MKYILPLLLLTGCAATPEQVMSHYKTVCQDMGFKEYSVEYVRCVQQGYMSYQDQQASRRGALMGLGLGIMSANRPTYVPRSSLNCTSVQQGVFTNYNCY